MIRAILITFMSVTLTVFLNPLAERLYNARFGGSEPRHRQNVTLIDADSVRAYSSVLERLSGLVWGSEFAPEVACIVGEAEDQSYRGMLAVAGAIRNRGHLKGVYGCQSRRLPYVKRSLWLLADKAWKESAQHDITGGADHWHSVREPEAWWEKYGTLTVVIGEHKFYKEVHR